MCDRIMVEMALRMQIHLTTINSVILNNGCILRFNEDGCFSKIEGAHAPEILHLLKSYAIRIGE